MTIDKSGRLWKGTRAADIDEFLAAYSAGGYNIARVVHSRCGTCSGTTFALRVDDENGYADRRCVGCDRIALMLDSADQADEASPEECACPCGGETFELAVGYAPRSDGEIRWVSVGARCVDDGTLGVYTDWKIDYGPTDHLFDSA